MKAQKISTPKPYKTSPALSNSRWYKGFLFSQNGGYRGNKGAFDLDIAKMTAGAEPVWSGNSNAGVLRNNVVEKLRPPLPIHTRDASRRGLVWRSHVHSRGSENIELMERYALEDPHIERLIRALHAETEAGAPTGRLFGESIVTALAVYLAQRHSSSSLALDSYRGGMQKHA